MPITWQRSVIGGNFVSASDSLGKFLLKRPSIHSEAENSLPEKMLKVTRRLTLIFAPTQIRHIIRPAHAKWVLWKILWQLRIMKAKFMDWNRSGLWMLPSCLQWSVGI